MLPNKCTIPFEIGKPRYTVEREKEKKKKKASNFPSNEELDVFSRLVKNLILLYIEICNNATKDQNLQWKHQHMRTWIVELLNVMKEEGLNA